jgi:hypothetical protein
MRALPWIRAAVGLGALALFLAAAVPVSLRDAGSLTGWARQRYRLDAAGARSAVFGEPYVRGVEQVRRLIPEDAAYFLVNAVPEDEGPMCWVRYELAPRRAVFLGDLGRMKRRHLRLLQSRPVEWVVIAYGAATPPRALPRQELVDSLVRRLGS